MLRNYLKDNPDVLQEIEQKVRDHYFNDDKKEEK